MLLLNGAEKKPQNIKLDGDSRVRTRAEALGEHFKQSLAVKTVVYWPLIVPADWPILRPTVIIASKTILSHSVLTHCSVGSSEDLKWMKSQLNLVLMSAGRKKQRLLLYGFYVFFLKVMENDFLEAALF